MPLESIKMEDDSLSVDNSIIKIEADDIIIRDENGVNEDIVTSSESLITELKKSNNCSIDVNLVKPLTNFRSSRLSNKTSIVTSEVNNIYAKPRMHFTGKGIVTKTQPGYSFTLKKKRGRKQRIKDKIKEERVDVESSVPRPAQEIIVGIDSSINNRHQGIKVEVEVDSTPESESFFYIKKKRDRRFPKVLESDGNLIHPNYYMDIKRTRSSVTEREDMDQTEFDTCEDRFRDNKHDIPLNCFLNKKMFKRVGHYSDGLVECTICFKQMKDTSMKQHFKTHSGAKPFPCNFCGARFTRKGDVYRHRKTIHRNIKPFECSMCERRFVERKSLISHLQNHDRMLYYACTTCGFKFGKREYYENHIRFIHPLPEGQSLTDVKDIVEKGLKQLEILLAEEQEEAKSGKKSSSPFIRELESNVKDEVIVDVKVEKEEDLGISSDESRIDPMSPESSFSQNIDEEEEEEEEEDEEGEEEEDLDLQKDESVVNVDNVSVVKGTLSLTQRVPSQEDLEAQEEEELVNKAIRAAVSQAETALENIQSTIGNNMTSKSQEKSLKTNSSDADAAFFKLSKKIQPKSSEIHINATVGGSLRKFIVQIPSGSNIDATTQEGMDTLVNMVNYLCSGKGELNGPVEVVMHHTI